MEVVETKRRYMSSFLLNLSPKEKNRMFLHGVFVIICNANNLKKTVQKHAIFAGGQV